MAGGARDGSQVDLDLLVVLVEVVEASSVKAAARRLALTPSAVSHALARLRARMGDPLVVRTPDGMRATDAALALVADVRPALDHLRHALQRMGPFEPRALTRTFTIASAGFGTALLVPRLLAAFATAAPGVRLRVVALPQVVEAALAREVDVMIGVLPRASSPALQKRRLAVERYVSVVRREHPHAGPRFTLAQYAAQRHLVIAPRGQASGPIDEALARAGLARQIAVTVEDFVSAPFVVAASDLVLTAAERFLREAAPPLGLRVVELDADLPRVEIAMVWHENRARDPAHRWLRDTVADVAREIYGRSAR